MVDRIHRSGGRSFGAFDPRRHEGLQRNGGAAATLAAALPIMCIPTTWVTLSCFSCCANDWDFLWIPIRITGMAKNGGPVRKKF